MKRYSLTAIILLIVLASYASDAWAAPAYKLEWIRQMDMGGPDSAYSVAVDASGNAFISGARTVGGTSIAFLAKYDTSGSLLWKREHVFWDAEWGRSVAVDKFGNAYMSGNFNDNGPLWTQDAFLTKYDSTGTLIWTRQFGANFADASTSVAIDPFGNTYVSGVISSSNTDRDAFLAKYDSSGTLLWSQSLDASSHDTSYGVAVDALGNAYIAGETGGSLGGPFQGGARDAFVAKYDTTGNLLWTRQLGTSGDDRSFAIAVDASGNAYTSGWTLGSIGGPFAGGFSDAFLAKYDASGDLVWKRQFGTSDGESGNGVAVDEAGNVYMSGSITIGTNPFDLVTEAFLAVYDYTGSPVWTAYLTTNGNIESSSVAVDASGNVFISGSTSNGGTDAFLAKFVPIPEPGTIAMIAMAFAGIAGMALRRRRK